MFAKCEGEKMTVIDVKKCTGCAACSDICPKGCISMREDEEGFIKPFIDGESCINCGSCFRNCPQEYDYNYNDIKPDAYAFVALDKPRLLKSSSGGAFISLAKYVLNKGGVVFGAAYDKKFFVKTIPIEKLSDLYKIQGSKYIQSSIEESYTLVKRYLKTNRMVLFSGTPCQIAGLYAVLDSDREDKNLITVEVLCHGVPNNKLFQIYLKYIAEKYGQIYDYTFRDKQKWGWGNWGSFTYMKNGKFKKKYFLVASDYFYSLYFKENIFRESCYDCKYATLPRLADITLGDFWGAEQLLTDFNLKEGVSLIMNNNIKAKKIFAEVTEKEDVKIEKISIEKVIPYNQTIIQSVERPESRDKIFFQIEKYGFLQTANKYCKIHKVTPIIARYIPKKIKIFLKKSTRRENK